MQRLADQFAFDIDKLYLSYTCCMTKVKKFEIDNGAAYEEVYTDAMQSDGNKTETINDVDECRATTRFYWRLVRRYIRQYKDYIDENELEMLRRRHARFVELMKPLDKYDDYDDDENQEIYNLFKNKD